jgi:hypothetical protein
MSEKGKKNVPCSVWVPIELRELLRWLAYVENSTISKVAKSGIEYECRRIVEARQGR